MTDLLRCWLRLAEQACSGDLRHVDSVRLLEVANPIDQLRVVRDGHSFCIPFPQTKTVTISFVVPVDFEPPPLGDAAGARKSCDGGPPS